jgi:hypothetical protein
MFGLVVKEISRNSLVEQPKKVNMINIIGPKEFKNKVLSHLVVSHNMVNNSLVVNESVVSHLVLGAFGDSLVELLEEVSAMTREFKDNFHYEFPNSLTSILDTQLVINFEQPSKLIDSSPTMLDVQRIIC